MDALLPDYSDSRMRRSEEGRAVVEVGPGKGALTALLLSQYPMMKAIEVDQVREKF